MLEEDLKGLERSRVTRRDFLKGLGLAAGTVALTSTFGFRGFAMPEFPIKVGTLLDYTGALAEFGPPIRTGADLAAKHLNEAAKEVLGIEKFIELIHEDSGTTAAIGIDRARKLIEVDKVPAIMGSLASGVTIPIAVSVTIPAKVVQISPASTSPLLTVLPEDEAPGAGFLFRTCPSDALQGKVLAMMAWEKCIRTASTIYVNNPYGEGLSRVFKETFEALGGKVLAEVPHPEEPKPTYVAELEGALAGKPDFLVAISYPGHATVYLKEAIDVFGYRKFLYVDGTKSIEIIKAVGAENVEKGQGTAPAAAITASKDIFIAEYVKEYGPLPPLPYIDNAYDAIAVIGLASYAAVAKGAAVTGTNIRDNLRFVSNPPGEVIVPGAAGFRKAFDLLKKGQDINYEGAAGSQDFDEHGDVITPVEIWMYTKGTIRTLKLMEPIAHIGVGESSKIEQPYPSDFVTGVKVACLRGAIDVNITPKLDRSIKLTAPDWTERGRRPYDTDVYIHVQEGPADFIKYWIYG